MKRCPGKIVGVLSIAAAAAVCSRRHLRPRESPSLLWLCHPRRTEGSDETALFPSDGQTLSYPVASSGRNLPLPTRTSKHRS